MTDPRATFVSRIEIGSTRVRDFCGFFFLCGGENGTAGELPPRSVRHLICNEISSGGHRDLLDKLRLAEDIQDWFRDGKYRDLVTFEEHLASLASVILLVVESAGSIAELGAFSVSEVIGQKLIAVVAEHHYEADSYIRLGPISLLENRAERPVLVHDWHDRDIRGKYVPNVPKLTPNVAGILGDVRRLLNAPRGERTFKWSDPAHVMIMICELCDLFGALNDTEIRGYLGRIAPSVSSDLVEQFLFLLLKCGLLGRKAVGHGRYYHAVNWVSHVVFAFNDGPRIDRDRVRVDVFEYYKSTIASRADVVAKLRAAP